MERENATGPDRAELWRRVSAVVAESSVSPPPYAAGTDIYRDLGIQSIHALNILLALEQEFGVTLDDRKFVQCDTIDSLVDLVAEVAR